MTQIIARTDLSPRFFIFVFQIFSFFVYFSSNWQSTIHRLKEIRTAGTADNPLFCLADVCKAVGLTNPSNVKARLDKEDVQLIDLHALSSTEGQIIGNSMINFVTESGFYDVILQSSSPNVKPFRKWITSEVLPSIRKTGSYSIANLSRKELAMMVIQAEEEKERLMLENKQQAAVIEGKNSITMTGLPNLLLRFLKVVRYLLMVDVMFASVVTSRCDHRG